MTVSTANKITVHLSDGRELIYFDDVDSTLSQNRNPDRRVAAERPAVAEMRLDSLTGDWISVASARNARAFLPPAHLCPLCPSSPGNLSEIPDNFDIAVFENKSPSFGPDLLKEEDETFGLTDHLKLGTTLPSLGRCEVVVFSPEHEGSLSKMPVSRLRTLIDAWSDRTEALQAMPGIRQVFPFENRGEEIGVTLHHPHGQIYAYPYVTPRTKKLLNSIDKFGPDLFQKTLEFESQSDRLLFRGEHFSAYVPFASRWPIEIHLLPNRHVKHLGELTHEEREELAPMYSQLLGALDRIYETPTPYISAWHQAPLVPGGENVRLQLQITSPRRGPDKLKFLAGSESAMGAFISDICPEVAAAMIKRAL